MNSYAYLLDIFVFVLGTVIGSFLNVCIHRIPKGQSIITPPSHCPACNQPVRFFDNIPLISYLILRGKCRYCGYHIPLRYPVVEFLSGSLSLTLFLKFGLSAHFLIYTIFVWSLLVITFIDLDTLTIPDVITLPGIVLGFFASFLLPQIAYWQSILGILLGGGSLYLMAFFYYTFTKREGMGGGDIKLLAMIGAFLGYKSILFVIFFSSLIGTLVGVIVMIKQRKGRTYPIPFGPFLAIGTLLHILWGHELFQWYLYR